MIKWVLLFLPKRFFQSVANQESGNNTGQGANTNPYKEMGISDMFLYPSCRHTRKHHSKCHETGSDGVVGSFVLTLRNINQIKHVSGKAEAIP